MRIPFMVRATALSLTATVALGAFGAAPLLAGQSAQPGQTPTYSIAAPAPALAGNATGTSELSDAQGGFLGFLGRPVVPSTVAGVPDGFGHLVTPGTGTVIPGSSSEGY